MFEWDPLTHQTAQWSVITPGSTVSVGGNRSSTSSGGELKLIKAKAKANEGAASYLWLRAWSGDAGFCVRHIRFVATAHTTTSTGHST